MKNRYVKVPLETRIRAIKRFAVTDNIAAKQVLKNITNMPFADYMFHDVGAYKMIMRNIYGTSRSKFPDISVGEACACIAEIYERYPEDRSTMQIIENMQKPYDRTYAVVNSKKKSGVNYSNPMDMECTWDLVKEIPLYTDREAKGRVELEKRIAKVQRSKAYKKVEYENYARNGVIPNEYSRSWMQLLIGMEIREIRRATADLTGKQEAEIGIGALCRNFPINQSTYFMDFCDRYLAQFGPPEKFSLFVETFAEVKKAEDRRRGRERKRYMR